MQIIDFKLFKDYIYKKCVERVEKKRLSETPIKPQYSLFPDDKGLVSKFFNCKIGPNNKYLIPKRLLNSEIDGIRYGAVPVFNFTDEHEVLWGDTEEFNNNLPSIFIFLLVDILNSKSDLSSLIEDVLCDNIIFAKYYSLFLIKDIYDISLIKYFAVPDEMVDKNHMNKYLKIALNHLYNRPNFETKFRKIFLNFTYDKNSYTHIDERLTNEFIPELIPLLKEYLPTEESLGLRVKAIINSDMLKVIDQLDGNIKSSEFKINKKLINASSTYITELEKIAYSQIHANNTKVSKDKTKS